MSVQAQSAQPHIDKISEEIKRLEKEAFQDPITVAELRLRLCEVLALFDQAEAARVMAENINRLASAVNQGRSWA